MQKTKSIDEVNYLEMTENTNEALLLFKGQKLVHWNERACNFFNLDYNKAVEKDFEENIALLKKSSILKLILSSSSKNAILKRELELKRNNNETCHVEVTLLKVGFSKEQFVQCTLSDITFLRKSVLNESYTEEKFKKIFDSVTDGILVLTTQGEILEVNKLALNRSGFSREEFMKLGADYFLKDDPSLTVPSLVSKINKKEFTSFVISYTTTYGFKVPIEVYAKKIMYENQEAIIIVTRDISERLLMEKKIFEVEINTQEKERQRVASELHDGISPILSTIKLYAQSLQQDLTEEIRKELLVKMTKAIDESIQAVSDISNNLSPHLLRHFGLIEAINSFIEKINESTSIKINFNYNSQERVDIFLETYIYRIITELLNNSVKHAFANQIDILFEKNNENIYIEFSDNGKGFDFEGALDHNKGMGIKNIMNRVKTINGKLKFTNENVGIKYILEIPLTDILKKNVKN